MIRDKSAISEAQPDTVQSETVLDVEGILPGGTYPPKVSSNTRAKARVNKIDNLLYRFVSSVVEIPATTQQKVVGNSTNRRYLMIQNKGANTVLLGFSSRSHHLELPSGGVISFETGIIPSTEIYAYSLGGSTLAIVEGVIL